MFREELLGVTREKSKKWLFNLKHKLDLIGDTIIKIYQNIKDLGGVKGSPTNIPEVQQSNLPNLSVNTVE